MEEQPEYVTKTGGVLHPYQLDGEKTFLGLNKEDCATRTEKATGRLFSDISVKYYSGSLKSTMEKLAEDVWLVSPESRGNRGDPPLCPRCTILLSLHNLLIMGIMVVEVL